MRLRFSKFECLLTAAVAAFAISGQAQTTDQLRIGTLSTHCASPTVVGPTQCSAAPEAPKPKPKTPAPEPDRKPKAAAAASAAPSMVGGVSEAEVDEYLQNYGKPAREVVRALLNPSDENISAMLRKERSQMAVAAYTAQRRLELSQQESAQAQDLDRTALPSLIGTKITVVVTPDCRECEKILRFVNQLVTEFPSVEARIGVVGQFDLKAFLLKTAALDVYLQTSPMSPQRARQLGIKALPAIVVGDSRFLTESVLPDQVNSALDLEIALVRMRKRNEAQAAGEINNKKGT